MANDTKRTTALISAVVLVGALGLGAFAALKNNYMDGPNSNPRVSTVNQSNNSSNTVLNKEFEKYSSDFDTKIDAALNEVQSAGFNQVADRFKAAYDDATNRFSKVSSGESPFNNATSAYFYALDHAKNQLAASLGYFDDKTKDSFINTYNQARDVYGGQIAGITN